MNTRAFPCGDPRPHASELTYEVLDAQGQWQHTDLASFLATDDVNVTTVIFVHGNRSSASVARYDGLQTYKSLTRCTTCDTPMRFVIYSWPSEQIKGVLDDIRVKAARAIPNTYYLAWLIDQIGSDVPVSLIGHSYGGHIVTGGLHLLGGGAIKGWTLEDCVHPSRRPMNVVLAAAALDNHWLIPGHRHGNAMSQVAHMTVLYNSCDPVLKRYRFLYCRKSNAEALGYTGVAGLSRLGADRAKISQRDVCCQLGKVHSWDDYIASGSIMVQVRHEVFAPAAPALAGVSAAAIVVAK